VNRVDARRLYYALAFVLAASTGWVVFDLYLVRILRLSPLQLILMGTVMEATIFVFEVPTGVVADVYSRRLSYIVGVLGMGAAVVGVGLASAPWLVIALWGLWGLAYTFTSGAYEAWVTDEIGVENVGSLFLRGSRVTAVGSLVGLAGGVVIGYFSLRAAVISCGALEIAAGIACVFLMPETGFVRRPHEQRAFLKTAAEGVRFIRARRLLLILAVTELIAGFGAEAFDRLTEAHVIRDVGFPAAISPVLGFGAVSAISLVFAFFAVTPLIRRVDRDGVAAVGRMLVFFTVATIVAQIAFAVGTSFWFVMAVFLAAILARSLLDPLYTTWVNDLIRDSSVRATVLSISGQANAIGQAAGGPVLGVVGNVFGIPYALVAGALTTLPAAALYARATRRQGQELVAELPQPTG
jgi:DHA3 family tetracycline resistance protein-like MFS transporter